MRSLLFVHQGEKVKVNSLGVYYTDGSYSDEIWDRYLRYFDKITIFMRRDYNTYSDEELESHFNPISSNKIQFIEFMEEASSIKEYLTRTKIKENFAYFKKLASEHDFVILRVPGVERYVPFLNKINKPYFLEIVGCPFDTLWNHSFKGKVMAPISYLSLKRNVKKAKNAIYVTNSFLEKRYPCKGNWIGCSDAAIDGRDDTTFAERVSRIQNNNNITIIGTIGAIDVNYKGQDDVIQALSILKEKGTRVIYQIVGGGDKTYLSNIAKKYNVEDQIVFIGAISHNQIFDWLKSIDLYIQPSKTEGLPRSVVEAMSMAVPCLGSSAGGIPELLRSDYIFKKGNIRMIAIYLEKYLFSKELLQENASFVYKKSELFEKDTLIKKRNAFVDKIIK